MVTAVKIQEEVKCRQALSYTRRSCAKWFAAIFAASFTPYKASFAV